MNNTEPRYWEEKSLDEMSDTEWESLCDGCGKCCLHKLEDEDTGEIHYTNIACRYLDDHCQCTEYRRRRDFVAGCVCLVPGETRHFHWLPSTCAYRLIAEGKPLATWHPLNSGNPETIHLAGISVRGRVLSDAFVHEDGMEEHIITWVQ